MSSEYTVLLTNKYNVCRTIDRYSLVCPLSALIVNPIIIIIIINKWWTKGNFRSIHFSEIGNSMSTFLSYPSIFLCARKIINFNYILVEIIHSLLSLTSRKMADFLVGNKLERDVNTTSKRNVWIWRSLDIMTIREILLTYSIRYRYVITNKYRAYTVW